MNSFRRNQFILILPLRNPAFVQQFNERKFNIFLFFFEGPKGPMINQSLWKKPIVLQERSVSRTPGKKHQTKPPTFTESVGSSAPSLERVHVASFLRSIDRIFFSVGIDRGIARKRLPGEGKVIKEIRVHVVKDARLRMHCPFTGNSSLFLRGVQVGGHFARKGTTFAIGWIAYLSCAPGTNRGYIEREARTRCESNA